MTETAPTGPAAYIAAHPYTAAAFAAVLTLGLWYAFRK
jgi:hypothetical protein